MGGGYITNRLRQLYFLVPCLLPSSSSFLTLLPRSLLPRSLLFSTMNTFSSGSMVDISNNAEIHSTTSVVGIPDAYPHLSFVSEAGASTPVEQCWYLGEPLEYNQATCSHHPFADQPLVPINEGKHCDCHLFDLTQVDFRFDASARIELLSTTIPRSMLTGRTSPTPVHRVRRVKSHPGP